VDADRGAHLSAARPARLPLPGPKEAQQLATYIGWLMHRTLGGIMAGGLFILPGVVAIMALSYVYAGWGNLPRLYLRRAQSLSGELLQAAIFASAVW
jgi:chromate transport protein ChrA